MYEFHLNSTLNIIKVKKISKQLEKMQPHQQKKIKNCSVENHQEFYDLLQKIKAKNQIHHSLQTIDDLYGLKKYKIMNLSPSKILKAYESICQRILSGIYECHTNCWVGYELKVFLWIIICDLFLSIKELEKISISTWEKYQRIFHGKSIKLMQYQIKLVISSKSINRKWEKQQDLFLNEIIKSNFQITQWSQIAKKFYFQSNQTLFRTPKQIRERVINHYKAPKNKIQWTLNEDYQLISNVMKQGKKWARIAKLNKNNRTDHAIKNRFHTLISKQLKLNPCFTEIQKIYENILIKLSNQSQAIKNAQDYQKNTHTKFECSSTQNSDFNKKIMKINSNQNIADFNQIIQVEQIIKRNQKYQQNFIQLQYENWLQNPQQMPQNSSLRYLTQQQLLKLNKAGIHDFSIL